MTWNGVGVDEHRIDGEMEHEMRPVHGEMGKPRWYEARVVALQALIPQEVDDRGRGECGADNTSRVD